MSAHAEENVVIHWASCTDPEGDYCRMTAEDDAAFEAWLDAQPQYPDVPGVEQMELPLFTVMR